MTISEQDRKCAWQTTSCTQGGEPIPRAKFFTPAIYSLHCSSTDLDARRLVICLDLTHTIQGVVGLREAVVRDIFY